MLSYFIKIALRRLQSERLYSLINIAGLSTGIVAALFILIYIADELSYDRFHQDYDRIHRVCLKAQVKDRHFNSPIVSAPLSEAAGDEFPEIEARTRIFPFWDHIVKYGDLAWNEKGIAYVDSGFFSVFTFPLLAGDQATALLEPYSVVITDEMEQKYFGDESGMGRMLMIGNYPNPFKVTGILANMPSNSHFHFDALLPLSSHPDAGKATWLNNDYYTYFLLREGASAEQLARKLPLLVEKYFAPQAETLIGMSFEEFRRRGDSFGYYLQPLSRIHLHSHLDGEFEANGDIRYIYIFAAISLFLLLIATINFMNLSTARFMQRSTEVGIRKTLGSPRRSLVAQFLLESLMITAMASAVAFLLTVLFLPQFNFLSAKSIGMADLIRPWFIGTVAAITIVVGLLSGSYPALYLSSHKPVKVLKSGKRSDKAAGRLRNGLVVFQFFISITLIVCTLVVYRQLQHLMNSDDGMNTEQVMNIPNAPGLKNQLQSFKNRLLAFPSVRKVAVSSSVPPNYPGDTVFRIEGTTDDNNFARQWADADYLPALGIDLRIGRNFSPEFPSDSSAVILNETAVLQLGWNPEDEQSILGRRVLYADLRNKWKEGHVIGVTRDYNFYNVKQEIRPLAIFHSPYGYWISIKLEGENMQESIVRIKQLWDELAPGEPFEYSFMDERYGAMLRSEQRMGRLFAIFTGITIVIACLGLFGLSAYTVERKTKEIGIRKALGASSLRIVGMLSFEHARLVIIALLPAIPVAWYMMHHWLTDFTSRVSIGADVFLLAGTGALLLAGFTVGAQSLRAALANPTHALRYE